MPVKYFSSFYRFIYGKDVNGKVRDIVIAKAFVLD